MSGWFQPPQRDVELVREPRQRIPADRSGGERPADRSRVETRLHVLVFVDELAVVVVEERVAGDLAEDEDREAEKSGDHAVVAGAQAAERDARRLRTRRPSSL